MKATIDIYSPAGSVIASPLITKEAEVRESLMADDYAELSWADIVGDTLPAGAYIVLDGERYTLLDPHTPEQRSEAEWRYSPRFSSRVAAWAKKPLFLYTHGSDGVITRREPDFNFTGSVAEFAALVAKAILHETGEEWNVEVAEDLAGYKTLSFAASDIAGGLGSVAEAFETEWLADKSTNTLRIGRAMLPVAGNAEPVLLEVGTNIGVPAVSTNKEGYYNRYYIYGSTRNITQDYEGSNVNNLVNKRLTLDPAKYPGGYIDRRADDAEPVFPMILTFDDVYPRSNLVIKEARPRLMYTIADGTTDRLQIGTDADGKPVYDQYAVWYVQLEAVNADGTRSDYRLPNTDTHSKDNPDGVFIAGKNLSAHFDSGSLKGREFELRYHPKAETLTNSDGVTFAVRPGDFEIVYTKDNNFVIPSMTGIVPGEGDKVVLYNLRMPSEYTAGAYAELEEAAFRAISEREADSNNYEFDSDPVAFSASPAVLMKLRLGQTVTYRNGSYSHTTRIIAITRKLDIPCEQTVTIGNKIVKGSRQTLREDVTNANRDISLMASFNALTQATINNYNHAQRAMLEGFERISKMWQLDEEGRIYTPYAAYSLKDVAAFGPSEDIGGGGLSEEALGAYLAREGYATQAWVREYVAANAPSVDLSAYLAKTEAAALYQPKGSYAAAAHTHGQYLTAHQDISHLLAKTEAAALYQPKGNYAAAAHSHDAYISAIGTSGDKLTYTKGTTTTSLYVPFASRSGEVCVADAKASVDTSQSWQAYRTDLKARFFDVYDNGGPDSYGCVLEIAGRAGHWQPQLWFGGWVNGVLRHRNRDYNSGTWGPWHTLLDTANYAATLDTRYMRRDTFDELFEKVTVDGSVFIKAKLPFFSTGDVAAFGPGADIPGGSGGAAYDRLDAWGDYSAAKAGWVLSAALGHDLHTRLGNVYGKSTIDSMLAGFVTLATRQEIGGEKIFTNSVYVTNGRISGEISSAYTNHGIRLGIASRDYCDFLEYGAVWNFYKSRSGTETLVAKISEAGISASAFLKVGGTASEVLMADGSVQPHWKAADVTAATSDRGMITPLAMNQWATARFVTALGISGDNITWTRNGATNSIAVPYAAESSRMRVADIRDITMTPAAFNSKTVTAWFNQTGTPSSTWYAGITVKGWTDGYAAWQLCANSAANTADTNLYFRIGINSSFQAWQKVLTDANFRAQLDPHYLTVGTDQEVSGAKTFLANVTARHPATTGGSARGFVVSNHAGTEKAAFGSFCSAGAQQYAYVGWGADPWNTNYCLAVSATIFKYKGYDILHAANYSNLVNAVNQPLTIRCGNDAKLIFDNTDGERYTRLSFREAGTEYAGITAHSEAFIFSGKPVSAPYFKADRATLCPNLNADLLDGLHLSRTPAANAVPAYDADTMLPVSAGLKMQNDKMAELPSPGWYRVFSSHSADGARASLLLFLGRNYNHTNNENYIFSISLGCGSRESGYRPTVTQLSGRAVGGLIPKIRVLQKWNSVYHVDIYYSGTVANGVYSFGIGPGRFAAPVAAAIPDGYTSYEFDTVPNGFRCDGAAEATDLRLSRYLFFKHPGGNTGIYLSPNPDGSLSISAHSGYSYAKSLGSIGYDGCFRITHRTAIGPSGFGVGLQLRDDNHTGIEVCGGNTTMGMGCHRDGRWYWWRGTTDPGATSDKKYVMNFDGTVFNFGDRDIAVRRVYLDSACTVWFQYNAAKGVIEASHTIVSRKDVAAFSA